MLSFLKKFFIGKKIKEDSKNFHFAIYDDKSDAEDGCWYRINGWKYPSNYLRMESKNNKGWEKISPYEEKVMGIEYEGRWKNFLVMGDQDKFKMFLEKEPTNAYDKYAIKVMGSALIDGQSVIKQIGYLQKDTAELLKNENDLKVGSASVSLPYEGKPLVLKISILTKSNK